MRSRFSVIISMVLLFAGCKEFTKQAKVVVVFADKTDTAIPSPSIEDVMPFMDTQSSPNVGIDLYYRQIGATDYSNSYRMTLPAVSLLENTHQRSADIKKFYSKVDSLFTYESKLKYHYNNSSILFPLLEQLKELSKKGQHHTSILLFSDLIEASDLFNSYQQENRVLNDNKAVAIELASILEIPKVSNTTLHVLFEPKNKRQNRLFRSWITIYRELFKDSGITIKVGLQKQWNHE